MNGEINQFQLKAEYLDDIRRGYGGCIGIHLAGSHEIIGSVSIWGKRENSEKTEIGWEIDDPRYRNKGIMSWALQEVAKQGIEEGWFSTLYATIFNNNIPSIKTAEKLGLKNVPEYISDDGYECKILRFEASADEITKTISARPLPEPIVSPDPYAL